MLIGRLDGVVCQALVGGSGLGGLGTRSEAWAAWEARSEAAWEACQAKDVRLVGWLVGWLVSWLNGWLGSWLNGLLVGG